MMIKLDIINETIGLGEKLADLLKSVQQNLVGNKEQAAKELVLVIDEVVKFYQVAQEEMSSFQNMNFSDPTHSMAGKKILLDIQSGMMQVRIAEASGSCAKIKRVYESHLDTWFLRIFGKESVQYMDTQKIFNELSAYDISMIEAAKNLETYFTDKSAHMLIFLSEHNTTKLIEYHTLTIQEVTETRKKLSLVVKQLVDLKNDFFQSAEII
jgi:hypothetical protein